MQALAPPEPVVVKNVDFLGLNKLVLVPFCLQRKMGVLYTVHCTRLEGGKNWFFPHIRKQCCSWLQLQSEAASVKFALSMHDSILIMETAVSEKFF